LARSGFLYTDPNWVEQVVQATGGGVDVVISGTGANVAEALGCLEPGGRIAVFGSSAGRTATFEVPSLYFGLFAISGTTLGSPTDFGQMLQFVEKHQIRPVIDSTWADQSRIQAEASPEARKPPG
jgi:zinc-binding alcohol dehydrogenase/oxidoreductase